MGVLEEEKQPETPEATQVQRPPFTQTPDPLTRQDPAHPTCPWSYPKQQASCGVSQGRQCCAVTSPSAPSGPIYLPQPPGTWLLA